MNKNISVVHINMRLGSQMSSYGHLKIRPVPCTADMWTSPPVSDECENKEGIFNGLSGTHVDISCDFSVICSAQAKIHKSI